MRFTEPQDIEGSSPSIGTVDNAYDNNLTESFMGPSKTECVDTHAFREGTYRQRADVDLTPAGWVHWWNKRRRQGPWEISARSANELVTQPMSVRPGPHKSGGEPGTLRPRPTRRRRSKQ